MVKQITPAVLAVCIGISGALVMGPRVAAAQAAQAAPVQSTASEQQQLKKEEDANKQQAKSDKAQRKALKQQEKAEKAARKAGTTPSTTAGPAQATTPR